MRKLPLEAHRARYRDSSNAIIVGATITAKNTATGDTIVAKSNSAGRYVFASLTAGIYDITIETPGFKKSVQSHVIVDVAASVSLDVTLVPGEVTQEVNVTAETPALQTADAALGGITDGRQLQELPINGRDYARFSLLVPGAVARSSYIADLSFDGLHTVAQSVFD